jgi:hypothetical protein
MKTNSSPETILEAMYTPDKTITKIIGKIKCESKLGIFSVGFLVANSKKTTMNKMRWNGKRYTGLPRTPKVAIKK